MICTPRLETLALEGLSPQGKERLAFSAFDALPEGDLITLVLDCLPHDLLARFRSERPGQFDWTPLGDGPLAWPVEVSRRAPSLAPLRTVSEALSWDHDRLDSLEARAFQARERGDLDEATNLYSMFAFGLRRHIRFEEEILFPEFDSRMGLEKTAGPTAVMRAEHLEILLWLDRIERSIGRPEADVDPLRKSFHGVLGDHNLKEEHVVYPGTDSVLSALERDALVARIQAF